jgi:cytochrome c551/c552
LTRRIVAVGILAAGVLPAASPAQAARPVVLVAPAAVVKSLYFSHVADAAIGLYVPGAGGTVSRASAIASLRRGKVENALLGGKPDGKILIDLVYRVPAVTTGPVVVVSLPPPGKHPNTRRYPVAILGLSRPGILTSDSTRIRGLVAITDIAPTAVALVAGGSGPIEIEPDDLALAELNELDQRFSAIHNDRGWTLTAVVFAILALVVALPRAGVLGGAAAICGSLLLSWAGATRLWVLILGIVAATIGVAVAASPRRRLLPLVVAAFFAIYLAVLALSPETNSLAVLGARPDGGGRFYGMTNQVETLLLPTLIAAVALAGLPWLLPLGALALVTVGWSKAGADGGGVLVFGTALAALALHLSARQVTARRVALAATAVVLVALALVGLDAVLGGSSHVTRAVGTGPGSLLGDLGHRLHLSWASATKALHNIVLLVGCAAALVWMGTRRPRRPTVDAMLAALVVSLFVNDTPVDVVGLGALGCLALLSLESVDSRPMRRGALTAACLFALLALAGCGDQGVVAPLPDTVVGTVKAEAPGKAIFVNQGCGACHTYEPAGPDANGQIGPDLDKLPEYAQTAKQPLAKFVRESIVKPDAYVEKGYPKGVMPKSYASIPPADLQALVDFLTKPQG